MNLNDYLVEARKTAVYHYPDYPLLALSEEVGEVMGKIAKYGRRNDLPADMVIGSVQQPTTDVQKKLREEVEKEMGDVLWQWANLCYEFGFDPSEVASKNIDKLQGRQERGTLNGEGDER